MSARRLLLGSPKINATRARGLALAAIRETCEETGLLIGRRDASPLEVPSPADGVLLRIVIKAGPARVEEVVGWIGERIGRRIQKQAALMLEKPKRPAVE